MSSRALIVLFIVTLVAMLWAGGVVISQPQLAANEKINGDPMFAVLNQRLADLQKLTIETAGYKVTWESRDGSWVAIDHGDYPSKGGVVADIVKGLAAMTKVEPKTDNSAWYQYIQVTDPATKPAGPTLAAGGQPRPPGIRVTAAAANGDVLVDTIVGSVSSTISAAHGRGGMFVRNTAEAQSWVVEGTVTVPTDLGQWFDPIANIPGPSIVSAAVLIGGKIVFEARKADSAKGRYELVHLDEGQGPSDSVANDTAIHNLGAGIVSIAPQDARSLDSVTPGPAARTDRFTTADGLQVDVTLADADGATWAIIKASAPGNTDAAKTATMINAMADGRALMLGNVQTTNLKTEVSKLVQPPGADAQDADPGAVPAGGNGLPFISPGPQGMSFPPGAIPGALN